MFGFRTLIFAILFIATVTCDVQCPDKESECPDGTTCCQMESGDWGCCPMPNAVCCSDKVHCCPEDTTCDLQEEKCNHQINGLSVPLIRKFPARKHLRASDVACDAKSSCPDNTTCCELPSGGWGCCPIPKAVCCSDKIHCCPEGTTCDVEQQKCVQRGSGIVFHWIVKITAKSLVRAVDVQCPDKESSCPDGTTCCQMSSGDYGCCPMPNAVCCSDKVHCCPESTTCDLQAEKCQQSATNQQMPWFSKFPARKLIKSTDIYCPDPSRTCQASDTCCKQGNPPVWGCCPFPNASCCPDNTHCCPSGSKCNNESQCVTDDAFKFRFAAKLIKDSRPAMVLPKAKDLTCPDKRSVCLGDEVTCCKMVQDTWGCCGIANATCCANRKFCCPQGTSCSLSRDKCTKPNGEFSNALRIKPTDMDVMSQLPVNLPLFDILTRNLHVQEEVLQTCDDGTTTCHKGTVCCETADGFGCCPHEEGQCCSDRLHCCPKNSFCNNAGCFAADGRIFDWSVIRMQSINNENQNKCPNNAQFCPVGAKCCNAPFGQYACCPDAKGTCCSGGSHCCPEGYSCQEGGKCLQKLINSEQ